MPVHAWIPTAFLAAALPAQEADALIPAEVVSDLARFDACAPPRQRQLAEVLRTGFALPADCGIRVLSCQTMPGPARATARDQLILSIEVDMETQPATTFRVLGDLDPSHDVRYGGSSRGWSLNRLPRSVAARLLETSRQLFGRGREGRLRLVACKGIASSNGSLAAYRLETSVGATPVTVHVNLALDPAAAEATRRELDALAEDVRGALAPLVRESTRPRPCSASRDSSGERHLNVSWNGIGFLAEPTANGWTYHVAGTELAIGALRSLVATAERQGTLGRDVWADGRSVRGWIEGEGFLILRCPRQPPAALPTDGAEAWLRANAQATLLVPARGGASPVVFWRPRPQPKPSSKSI